MFVVFLLWTGALSQTIDGVLVKPFRRIDSAMMHPPPPTELIYSLGLGLLLAMWASRRVTTMVAIVVGVVLAAVVYCVGRQSHDLCHGGAWPPGGSRCWRRPALRGC